MPCRVCSSPNRQLYETKRLKENYSYRQLARLSQKLGENIGYWTFWKHFSEQHHIKRVSKFTYVKPRTKEEEVKIVNEIIDNLETLRKLVQKLLSSEDVFEDVQKIRALKELLAEIRLTLKHLFEIQKKTEVKPSMTREQVVRLLVYLLKDESDEVLERIMDKLRRIKEEEIASVL